MLRGREPTHKRVTYLGDVFLPFPTAEWLGGKLSAKLPARVNTLAPAGVWNLLSLCQLATWRWVRLKECTMRVGVGDRGCIYTWRVCRGQ